MLLDGFTPLLRGLLFGLFLLRPFLFGRLGRGLLLLWGKSTQTQRRFADALRHILETILYPTKPSHIEGDKKDEDGDTPLHLAAEEGQTIIAEFLISKGAKVNGKSNNKETPLHLAAEKGHLEMVRLLIKKGADINIKNEKGETPLEIATKTRRKRIAELLKSKGAK